MTSQQTKLIRITPENSERRPSSLRLALAVARLEMTSYTRSPVGFLFALLAPSVIFLIAVTFWYPEEFRAAAVPDVAALSVLSTGLFSIGVAITEQRKEGTLKTYLASPLSKTTYLAGQIIDRVLVLFIGNFVMMLVAGLSYNLWPSGSPVLIASAFLLVIATMLALGFTLSSRMRSVETAGLSSTVLFGVGMIAAGFFPLEGKVPGWVLTSMEYLPFWPMVGVLRSSWFNKLDGLETYFLVLIVWFLILFLASILFFRWTPDDQ
ncbi:ABC-type transport system involved in multi-copper enzyme maturation, permease component [Actinomyces bovis]|uniref:ABC-type transport system involved in multi-copper enzyme maturation, permease component n=1 Tax=Actinomyces bovis TaxID=1658 RepID=A0ABY1VL04_9ACTO|nr:ABC transporter permease [Actinomyces bovis]SPT52786.1 ABC-type transport system involved in multi-copper enzyme maturation, permease component [Actinomyces bovis]VEG54815.1 ABC-type transport system involved in multi-copper enzyme maturation, permease component [Actinomyces israelii]